LKDVMIEVGRFILLSLIGGVLIFAAISFVATPAMITRYVIANPPHGDPNFIVFAAQAGLIGAIILFIAQFFLKSLSEA